MLFIVTVYDVTKRTAKREKIWRGKEVRVWNMEWLRARWLREDDVVVLGILHTLQTTDAHAACRQWYLVVAAFRG